MINVDRMVKQLVLHEGLRLKIYKDTEGFDTIGVGYNVSARGLDDLERVIGRKFTGMIHTDEALKILRFDIARFDKAIPVHFPDYLNLDDVRQRVVLDMAFNMGFKALGFKQAIAAVKARDWSRVVREMYKSRWSRQVGDGEGGKLDRCDRLASMILTGQDRAEFI